MTVKTQKKITKSLRAAGRIGEQLVIIQHGTSSWLSNGYFVVKLPLNPDVDAVLDAEGALSGEGYGGLTSLIGSEIDVGEIKINRRVLDGTDLPVYAHMPDGRHLALFQKGLGVISIDQAQIDAIEAILGEPVYSWASEGFRTPAIGLDEDGRVVAYVMPVRID